MLTFPQLLSFLLMGLGFTILISAIRPAATVIGAVLLGLGGLGLVTTVLLKRTKS